MILTMKQAVGNFIVFKLLKVCWIINAMLWNFIELSSDEVIQNSIRNKVLPYTNKIRTVWYVVALTRFFIHSGSRSLLLDTFLQPFSFDSDQEKSWIDDLMHAILDWSYYIA